MPVWHGRRHRYGSNLIFVAINDCIRRLSGEAEPSGLPWLRRECCKPTLSFGSVAVGSGALLHPKRAREV